MFTKEQKKQLREQFWNQFKAYSNKRKLKKGKPGKWIMNDTSISQLKLKFHFDEREAFAGFEIETRNLDKRIELFDKLEKLKSIIESAVKHELIWDLETEVSGGKTVSRVISRLTGVNVYNNEDWKKVNLFLYEVMEPIENVFLEYKDYLKYD